MPSITDENVYVATLPLQVGIHNRFEDAPSFVRSRRQVVSIAHTGFRLVSGERGAEIGQRHRLMQKYAAWTREDVDSTTLLYLKVAEKWAQAQAQAPCSSSRREPAFAKIVAERLRSLLSASPRREATRAEHKTSSRSSQFMALLTEPEELAFDQLLSDGELHLDVVMRQLGLEKCMSFVNRLGWAELAFIDDGKLRTTAEAKLLSAAIDSVLAQ
jgi:hypothetical protein